MLPFPSEPLPPAAEPPLDPIVIDTAGREPASTTPRPSTTPMVLWYLWLALISLVVITNQPRPWEHDFSLFLYQAFISNLLLTPAWAALAIRPLPSHLVSPLLVYPFVMFVSGMRREFVEMLMIFVIVAGSWSILRWCRVLALDLLQPADSAGSRTPRLADQLQFSLRALILMSAVVALGISLYLFFHDSSGWSFYKVMFFIVVPSELLLFWAMLGRAPWYIRLPWLLVAVHHWILLPVVNRGFVNWEQLYNWNEVPNWISLPLGQIIGLGLLRWAGYRMGIPKPREQGLPMALAVEPQSPWD